MHQPLGPVAAFSRAGPHADKRNSVRTAERGRNRVNLRFNIFVFANRLRDFRSLPHRNDVGEIDAFGRIFIVNRSGAASTIPSRISGRPPKTSSSCPMRRRRSHVWVQHFMRDCSGSNSLRSGTVYRIWAGCLPTSATVQNYFYAWRDEGVCDRLMDRLRARGRGLPGRSATTTAAAINTQSVKTTESGDPSGCGAGKKVKGRKHHHVKDVKGFPIEIAVHEALVQGRDGAPAVILGVLAKKTRIKKIWAGGGHQ